VTRLPASLLALALTVVLMAGCSSVAPYAATVNDHRLTQSDLEEELDAITSNEDYVKLLEQNQSVAVRGKGKGTFNATFVARILTREIFFELVSDEVARRKLTIDQAALEAARPSVIQQVGGEAVLRKFSPSYRDALLRRTAQLDALTRDLGGDEPEATPDARAFYDDNKATYDTYVCASHILVSDKAKADALLARINGGEDFAALARTESLDNQQGGSASRGGDLGCSDPTQYVAPFALAVQSQPVGQLSAPVQTDFGFHLIKVTARPPTFEQVQPQVEQQLANEVQQRGQTALNEWLQAAVKDATIKINPRYGTFSRRTEDFGVVPPKSKSTSSSTPSGSTPQP
jgi:foldase protein PrsA